MKCAILPQIRQMFAQKQVEPILQCKSDIHLPSGHYIDFCPNEDGFYLLPLCMTHRKYFGPIIKTKYSGHP